MAAVVSCSMLSTDFLSSASSLSRIASSNWARNSAAWRLMMPTYLPTVRNSAGRSLGPMTSSATMPRIKSLLEVKSNIGSTLWRAHKPVFPDQLRDQCCAINRRPAADQVFAPHPALLGSPADCCSLGLPPAPSKTLGGSSFLAGSSSSAMPFLKLLMPLATSPMIEEILPLPPNISRATARNSSQCQTLRLPISLSLPLAAAAAYVSLWPLSQKRPVRARLPHPFEHPLSA